MRVAWNREDALVDAGDEEAAARRRRLWVFALVSVSAVVGVPVFAYLAVNQHGYTSTEGDPVIVAMSVATGIFTVYMLARWWLDKRAS